MGDSRIIIEITGKDSASGVFKTTQANVAGSVRSMEISVNNSLSSITSRWGQFLSMFAAAQGIRSLTETATEIESITNKLKASVGGTEEAASAWRFLQSESEKLGLNLKTSADQFGSFAGAARGTKMEGEGVRQVFLAVAQASAVMGLSEEKSAMAMTALTQMISKGKVSSEELRRQLAEHIPGAFQIAARAMNMTTAELDKFISSGSLASDVFLPKFAAQLSKEMAGGLDAASMSMRANINRLENAWLGLKTSMVQGGFGQAATGMILDLTAQLKVLSDQIKTSADVPLFFSNLADGGKAIGSILIPAISGLVETLGSLARVYNELDSIGKSGAGAGILALLFTKNPVVAGGVGTMVILNQSMEQVNQTMKGNLLPSIQSTSRMWDIYVKSVQNVIDVMSGKKDWNTGIEKGLDFGKFRQLENQSVSKNDAEKILSQSLDSLMEKIDTLQNRRAALTTDPLGRIASGNADADAQNRAKAAVDARQTSEERINALLKEREQLLSGGTEQGEIQAQLQDATDYYNQLQKIIGDIKQSGRSVTTGFDRGDLQSMLEESAGVKAFMDEASASLREMSGQYSQQAQFLIDRAIYEERATLAIRQRQQDETQWLAVTSQIAELQKNLQAGNVNDSKVQSDITALLKTQSSEQQTLADLQAKRADAQRQMDSAANVDKWREMRDVVSSLDEQIGYAEDRTRKIGDALRSVPNQVSVQLSVEEESAFAKFQTLNEMFDTLKQQINVNVNTDAANTRLDALINKLDYLQKLGGSSFMMLFKGTGSPTMSFSEYYNYLVNKLQTLPSGSTYTVDFLTQQGGMTQSGAVSVMQQYATISSLQNQIREAIDSAEAYRRSYMSFGGIGSSPMATFYENTVIPSLASKLQEQNLSMMAAIANAQADSSSGTSSSGSGASSVTLEVNINTITIEASGTGRDLAVSTAIGLDAEITSLIKSKRSGIPGALEEIGVIE